MSEEKFKSNQHEEVMKELREMGSSLGDLGLQKFDDVPEDFWVKQEDAIFQKLRIGQNVKPSSKIRKMLPWISAIAASVALAIFTYTSGATMNGQGEEEFLENVALSELEEYILDEAGLLYDSGELNEAYLVIE